MATLQSEKFDVFCWLNNYFPYEDIVRQEIASVLDFCLMWNLFESKVCEMFGDDSSRVSFVDKMGCFIRELPSMNSLGNENLNSYLCYFQERYLNDGEVNPAFNSLNFRRSDRKPLVRSVLKDEEAEPSSMLLAFLIIIYRLRNKLFHGQKPIRELRDQDINFNVANIFLAEVLDLHKTLEG